MTTASDAADSESLHVESVHADRYELLREALIMALYISIAILAALVALPTDGAAGVGGVHGWQLAGVIWGTAIGLALAHWFAFDVVARGMAGGRRVLADVELAAAQIAGAFTVALLTTLPLLLAPGGSDQDAATWAPAIIVGVAGFGVARRSGRGRAASVITGVALAAVGVVIALIKIRLAGH